MTLKLGHKNFFYLIIIFSLLIFGLYLSYVGGYGSDEDTLPMIHVFEARLVDGTFISSRFTSYPVSEIGIGFLSHFFGSWAANSTTFIFYFLGLIITFFSFNKFTEREKLFLFIILSLSSQVLYFDNIEPIDYSWAYLFFSLGLFFFSRNIFELSVLFFAFAIGCRLNFILFIFIVIFLFKTVELIPIYKRLIIAACTFVTGGLFYLPIWFHYGFGLEWLDAARPLGQGVWGLFARFTYKTWMAFGFIQLILIVYGLIKLKKKILFQKNNYLFFAIIFSNLCLFFYIPAELSYLQPAIIFTYLIIAQEFNKKLVTTIIIINFISWVINFELLKINYAENNKCLPKNALSANINFKLTNGAVVHYFETRKMINCWIDDSTERGKRILEGKSTRLP